MRRADSKEIHILAQIKCVHTVEWSLFSSYRRDPRQEKASDGCESQPIRNAQRPTKHAPGSEFAKLLKNLQN